MGDRISPRVSADRGSGSVLGVAVLGAVIALAAIMLSLMFALSVRHAVAGTADAAALAAADARSGVVSGIPCDRAEQVAAINGMHVAGCAVDGLVVTVSVERIVLGMGISATATAGPPGT